MKKTFFVILPFLAVLIFGSLYVVHAQETDEQIQQTNKRTDENVVITKEETIDKDLFVSGEQVEVYGTINGDVYIAGGQLTIDGTINGDVLGAGGTIILAGDVSDDIRITGGNITIAADIGKSVTALGGNVNITGGSVGGNVVVAGGNVELDAPIEGNVTAGSGMLTVMGDIAGDVDAAVGSLLIASTASIGGDLEYVSEEEARISSESKIAGDVVRNEPPPTPEIPEVNTEQVNEFFVGIAKVLVTIKLFLLLGLLLVGALLTYYLPVYSASVGDQLDKHPWKSLGIGLLTMIIVPIVVLFLLITIVGMPLGLMLLAAYLILWYVSKIAIAIWVGRYVGPALNKKMGKTWQFVLGAVIVILLSLIPFVALLVGIAQIFGLGALVITEYQMYQTLRKKKLI